jgi:hypothetical protein
MSDAQDPRPSLAELRARPVAMWFGHVSITKEERDRLLDIARAAQYVRAAFGEKGAFSDRGPALAELEAALAKVRP